MGRRGTDEDEDDWKPPPTPGKKSGRWSPNKRPKQPLAARASGLGGSPTEKRDASSQEGHGARPGAVAVGPAREIALSRSRDARDSSRDFSASGTHSGIEVDCKDTTSPTIFSTDACLAIAAEVAPGQADLEAQVQARVSQERKEIVSEVHKQIMAQAGKAELVTIDEGQESNETKFCSKRRKWMILLGLLGTVVAVVVVVPIVVLLPKSEPDQNPDTNQAPTFGGCTLCTDGTTPDNLDALTLGDDGVTCSDFNLTQIELEEGSDACIQGQAEAWRYCSCPTLPLLPADTTCSLCGDPSIPLRNPEELFEGKTCSEWSTFAGHVGSSQSECTNVQADLSATVEFCQCLQFLIEKLFPISGDAISQEGTPQNEALRWLATKDPLGLTADAGTVVLQQRYILAVLYFATAGPSWEQDYGFLTAANACSWKDGNDNGVFCTSGVVTNIKLESNNLNGAFPNELAALTGLKKLELRNNGLAGTIPQNIGDLSGLERFDIVLNSMKGMPPMSLFTIQTLKELWLDGNDFNGSLPSAFGPALAFFTCKDCSLSGTIPPSIGDLKNLYNLDLSSNKFSGGLPTFSGSTRLEELRLHENDLTGALPSSLGDLLRLERLHIFDNKLTGTIPQSIADLPALSVIEIQGNQLDGPLPPFTGQQVSQVWAYGNNLTGTLDGFFSSTASATMTVIRLEENQFTGSLPESIGNFVKVEDLLLFQNQLTGTIPTSLGSLASIKNLVIGQNNLNGTIPSELGSLSQMQWIGLDHNFLTGTIPPSIGTLPSLTYFDAQQNSLQGGIPPFTSPEIVEVWLYGNLLTGGLDVFFNSTPTEKLTNVRFEENRLSGSLPETIGNFVQLEEIVLNENYLTGSIPSTLGNLANAVTVWVNKAGVTGSIPTELGRLINVKSLDLGVNDFTGTVPNEFENCVRLSFLGFELCGLTGLFPASVANLPELEGLLIQGNDFTNDFEATFCSRADEIDWLIANCLVDTIDCSCCTMCCPATGFNCVDQ